MRLDLDRVRANVRAAGTEDLMDRSTVWRDGMEPEALDIIEEDGESFGWYRLLRLIPFLPRRVYHCEEHPP